MIRINFFYLFRLPPLQKQLPALKSGLSNGQSYGAFNALPGPTLPIQVLVWRPRLVCCFGKLREVERDSPGSLFWKSLEAFKIASRTVVQPQELLEEAVAQPEEPFEEEDLLEVLVGDDTASELFEDD